MITSNRHACQLGTTIVHLANNLVYIIQTSSFSKHIQFKQAKDRAKGKRIPPSNTTTQLYYTRLNNSVMIYSNTLGHVHTYRLIHAATEGAFAGRTMGAWGTHRQEGRNTWLRRWRICSSLNGSKSRSRRISRTGRGTVNRRPLIEGDKYVVRVHKHDVKYFCVNVKIMASYRR